MQFPKFIILCLAISVFTVACKHKPNAGNFRQPSIKKTEHKDTTAKVVVAEPSLKRLVDELNGLLAIYDGLRVHENYPLKDFSIPEKELEAYMDDDLSQEKGKISAYVFINYYQHKIDNLLQKLLDDPYIIKYNLTEILDTRYISIARSSDGLMYCLVFDEKTGGTYRSVLSYIHYRAPNGKLCNYYPSLGDEQESGSIGVESSEATGGAGFYSDGYGIITTLQTKTGVKYLMQGMVVGCSTCVEDYIQLVGFKNGELYSDFGYAVSTRMNSDDEMDDKSVIEYDEKKKRIYINYMTNDLTPDCNCEEDDEDHTETETDAAEEKHIDTLTSASEEESFIPTRCQRVYVFNGNTFILQHKKKHKSR